MFTDLSNKSNMRKVRGKTDKPAVVIMAGGFGIRLRPFTENSPKPLLQVAGKPVLEHILISLVQRGFEQFYFALHYRADQIKAHFGDGSRWGANIQYLIEDKPLGTAGAIALIGEADRGRLLVLNGDILCDINYDALIDFHTRKGTLATMVVSEYEFTLPYGEVECLDDCLVALDEKPVRKTLVNAGIYMIEREAIEMIPLNQRFDMPSLFKMIIQSGKAASTYRLQNSWTDIGQLSDYNRMQDKTNSAQAETENESSRTKTITR